MAYIDSSNAGNRLSAGGSDVVSGGFVRIGEFNDLVNRVNSIATGAGTVSVSTVALDYLASSSTSVTNFIKFTGTVGTATNGTLFSTGSTWIDHATAGQCAFKILASQSAVTGDFATMRLRARNDGASGTGINGTATGLNSSASAGINNFGNLFAVQGYAQPNAYTNTDASNIVCGVYSCIDATTTSSGRRWSMWIDDHSTTKAAGGHYLLRMSDNGTTTKDGAITLYSGSGRIPVLINFEDTGCCNAISSAAATIAYQIVVKTPNGSLGYLNVYSATGT